MKAADSIVLWRFCCPCSAAVIIYLILTLPLIFRHYYPRYLSFQWDLLDSSRHYFPTPQNFCLLDLLSIRQEGELDLASHLRHQEQIKTRPHCQFCSPLDQKEVGYNLPHLSLHLRCYRCCGRGWGFQNDEKYQHRADYFRSSRWSYEKIMSHDECAIFLDPLQVTL